MIKISLGKIKICAQITCLLIIFSNYASIVWAAKLVIASNNSTEGINPLLFTKKQSNDDDDRDSERTPIGSRGGCPSKEPSLFALTQADEKAGLTNKTHPTFYVYVPYAPGEIISGEFSLKEFRSQEEYQSLPENEKDKVIYEVNFTLPATPGVVSITVPSTAPPLEINKNYEWYFELKCPPRQGAKEPDPGFVRGWVQRISLSLEMERELNAAKTPEERISFYTKNNIWYDRLDELSMVNPKNTTPHSNWTELLKSVGLKKIAQEPIVGSVKTNSPAE